PIAAEAEAASRSITQLPADAQNAGAENLPARIEPGSEVESHDERSTPLIPSIPDATKAAARWIRPLVPPFVARVIDNTTQPLRSARQVFEEVEEITFSLRRHRKVTVNSESTDTGEQAPRQPATGEIPSAAGRRIASSREEPGHQPSHQAGSHEEHSSLPRSASDAEGRSLGPVQHEPRPALAERDGPRKLGAPEGPRQLPPASAWE
ncbi:MAG: hypothetical protein QOD10_137, partial [Mycobacterium sp.]|nr:hypothetical protein [Mycobacterium sp.]